MSQTTGWVVVVTETFEGETTCEVVSEVFATEAEANDAACDMACNLGECEGRLVEVATEDEAAAVVTE